MTLTLPLTGERSSRVVEEHHAPQHLVRVRGRVRGRGRVSGRGRGRGRGRVRGNLQLRAAEREC